MKVIRRWHLRDEITVREIVCRIYDNMKTAVDKIGRGKQRQVNNRFYAMVCHDLFEPDLCTPTLGWEKG